MCVKNLSIHKKITSIVLGLSLVIFFACTNDASKNRFIYSETAKIDLPKDHSIHGIDLSHFNGSIKWSKLPKIDLFDTVSIKFVFLKATEGKTLVDKDFKANYESAKEKGLTVGAYHFFLPNRDPLEQAKNFCKTVKLENGDLPPVCDFEIPSNLTKEKLTKNIQIFLDKLQENYGVKPIIYTNRKLYQRIFKEKFPGYNYWIAHYEANDFDQSIENLVIWQHSKEGKLPGHSGSFDYNVFIGDEDDFNTLLIK